MAVVSPLYLQPSPSTLGTKNKSAAAISTSYFTPKQFKPHSCQRHNPDSSVVIGPCHTLCGILLTATLLGGWVSEGHFS